MGSSVEAFNLPLTERKLVQIPRYKRGLLYNVWSYLMNFYLPVCWYIMIQCTLIFTQTQIIPISILRSTCSAFTSLGATDLSIFYILKITVDWMTSRSPVSVPYFKKSPINHSVNHYFCFMLYIIHRYVNARRCVYTLYITTISQPFAVLSTICK